jgi:hypothetical protein
MQSVGGRSIVWQRTAPYLGVACLVLLAFGGVGNLLLDHPPLAQRQGSVRPATAWLAGPAAHALLGAAGSLATRGAQFTPSHAGYTGASAAGSLAVGRHVRALIPLPASPLARGALAIPALLVAVTLAQCR